MQRGKNATQWTTNLFKKKIVQNRTWMFLSTSILKYELEVQTVHNLVLQYVLYQVMQYDLLIQGRWWEHLYPIWNNLVDGDPVLNDIICDFLKFLLKFQQCGCRCLYSLKRHWVANSKKIPLKFIRSTNKQIKPCSHFVKIQKSYMEVTMSIQYTL